jgi:hypothetical protein
MTPVRPEARTEGLLIESIDDGLVVVDTARHVGHSLSAPAASVWRLADGRRTISAIAEELGFGQETVERAVGELDVSGLLVANGVSRREAAGRLARVGGAALSAPLVYSVVIRPPMAAASTHCVNPSCTADSDCCPGYWCDESQTTCMPTVANGDNMPNDPYHSNPRLNGICTGQAAVLVCTSKVCDTDNKCGYRSGDGPCTSENGGVVCRSGSCNPDTMLCS